MAVLPHQLSSLACELAPLETIPTFNLQSSITAQPQSSWLPPPAPRQQPLNSHYDPAVFQPQGDFTLYPTPAPQSHRRRPSSQPIPGHTFNGEPFYASSAPSSSANILRRQTYVGLSASAAANTHVRAGLHAAQFPAVMDSSNGSLANGHLPMRDASVDSRGMDFALYGLGNTGPTLGAWNMPAPSAYAATNAFADQAASTTHTVSPQDLLLSAPPSTVFTNLTSPSIQESPYIADSYENSPLIFAGDDSAGGNFPLFEDATNDQHPDSLQRSGSSNTFGSNSSNDSPLMVNDLGRNASVDPAPATPSSRKHSTVAGVQGRKRSSKLKPLVYNPDDKVALKRARNTQSARESRERRYKRMEELEKENREHAERVRLLEVECERYKQEAALLQARLNSLL